jgi:hypothetical protein
MALIGERHRAGDEAVATLEGKPAAPMPAAQQQTT